jgi:tRNA threonylcarbamoyladenosine biosynthesis protein TsaE
MNQYTLAIENEAAMHAFGVLLANALPDGTVVALGGTLGAGKTRLVQAVAQACGIAAGTVVSPTFVLMQAYQGDRSIYHFDAYRIKDDDEFLELGPDEYFESGGLSFVEWAERVADCMPRDRLEIYIEVTGENSRELRVTGTGDMSREIVGKLL